MINDDPKLHYLSPPLSQVAIMIYLPHLFAATKLSIRTPM